MLSMVVLEDSCNHHKNACRPTKIDFHLFTIMGFFANYRQYQTVIPKEDHMVRELTFGLREWFQTWKTKYLCQVGIPD